MHFLQIMQLKMNKLSEKILLRLHCRVFADKFLLSKQDKRKLSSTFPLKYEIKRNGGKYYSAECYGLNWDSLSSNGLA